MNRATIVALLMFTAFPAAAAAQALPQERCASAAAELDVSRGGAARSEAIRKLARCGEIGGELLARELRALSTASDRDELVASYYGITRISDDRVREAAISILVDRSATIEARIIALKVLITYHDPARASVAFESFLPGSQPSLTVQDHFSGHVGRPLAPGWEESAHAAILTVANDMDDSEAARFAARRALIYFGTK